jgi:hypothetical protein
VPTDDRVSDLVAVDALRTTAVELRRFAIE